MTKVVSYTKVCDELFVSAEMFRFANSSDHRTGTVTLRDETGASRTLGPGESFFIHRGSKVLFSSDDYGVCYKCAARPKGKL